MMDDRAWVLVLAPFSILMLGYFLSVVNADNFLVALALLWVIYNLGCKVIER